MAKSTLLPTHNLLLLSSQLYGLLLFAYPPHFRGEYGPHMAQMFRDCCRDVYRQRQLMGIAWLWITTLADLMATAAHEWFAKGPGPVHYIQKIGIGIAAGMAGGVAAGLGARLTMRGVALVSGLQPNFTMEGTITIAVIGLVMGTPFGVAFIALRQLLPGAGVWKGLVYGLLLFLVFMAPPLLFYREGEFLLAPPLVSLALFAPLGFVYGGTVAFTIQRLERNLLPASVHSQKSPDTPRLLSVISQIINLILFAFVLELAVLGTTSILNHMPRIPLAIVRTVVHDSGVPFALLRDVNIWLITITALGYFGLASLIFWSRSRRPMARFTGLALFLFGGALFNTGAVYYIKLAEPALLRPYFNLAQVVGVTALLALLHLFPNGRIATGWTRPLALAWLAFAALCLSMPLPEPFTFTSIITFFGSGLLAQLQRYHTADSDERRQLRWPLIGFTVALVSFSLVALAVLIVPDLKLPKVEGLAVAATFGFYMLPWLFIPITIGWAMRRHRLWAA